ncbi:hypothetical protein [Pleomorphovibrio marinus]|uniref:hypothetical protein n=1 Tax=Pleomorphovibrio marinus TaxID=2164132 RepID=UPI000E0A86CA|nr:hypothetical protein [Pleomorphovibrio marinus]
MKFKLQTTGDFYPKDEERKKLEPLGFKFIPSDYERFYIEGEPEIEINSLEDLIEFSNKFGELIISDGYIEIYDNYRE